MTPTLVEVKETLQGAHMDLEELQRDAQKANSMYGLSNTTVFCLEKMEEAGAHVYKATEVLDEITPEGT